MYVHFYTHTTHTHTHTHTQTTFRNFAKLVRKRVANFRACVDVLFILDDLSKAFDSIACQYNKLILKLSAYGLHPSVCDWIKSFLSDRKQRVVVNGSLSTWLSCPSEVPSEVP